MSALPDPAVRPWHAPSPLSQRRRAPCAALRLPTPNTNSGTTFAKQVNMATYNESIGKVAGIGRAASSKTGILNRLAQEHREVAGLFAQLKMGTSLPREPLCSQLRVELLTHFRAEERVLYDRLALTDLVCMLRREHDQMTLLLDRLINEPIPSEGWMTSFEQLCETFEAHAKREENQLFYAVELLWSTKQLEELECAYIRQRNLELSELQRIESMARAGS